MNSFDGRAPAAGTRLRSSLATSACYMSAMHTEQWAAQQGVFRSNVGSSWEPPNNSSNY